MSTADVSHLHLSAEVSIPLAELRFRFVRSSGPGGQHVNKNATQVELTFDVAHSPSLNETQRARVLTILKNAIDGEGVLHVEAQSTRSQLRNKQAAIERFCVLVGAALKPRKKRRPSQPTAAARKRRLENKKRRSAIKRVRRDWDP